MLLCTPFILHLYIDCSETPDIQRMGGILYQGEMPPPRCPMWADGLPDLGRNDPGYSWEDNSDKDITVTTDCSLKTPTQEVSVTWKDNKGLGLTGRRETYINEYVAFVKKRPMLAGRLCPQFPVLQKGATKMVS